MSGEVKQICSQCLYRDIIWGDYFIEIYMPWPSTVNHISTRLNYYGSCWINMWDSVLYHKCQNTSTSGLGALVQFWRHIVTQQLSKTLCCCFFFSFDLSNRLYRLWSQSTLFKARTLYSLVWDRDFVADSLYSGVEEMNRMTSLEHFLH